MLDVAHVEAVNDGHRHRVGDQVLAAIAHVMIDQKRQTDFAGRHLTLLVLPALYKWFSINVDADKQQYD